MKYITMLPFMDQEDLKELAYQVMNKEVKGVNIFVLYPFLNNETMDEIVDELIENGNTKDLQKSIPFISKEKVDLIQDAVQEGKLPGFKEEFLLPFLGRAKIKSLFKELIKKTAKDAVEETEEDPLVDEDPLDVEDKSDDEK